MTSERNNNVFLPITGGLGNQLFQLAAAVSLERNKISILSKPGNPRENSQHEPEILSFELPYEVNVYTKFNNLVSKRLISKAFGYCIRMGASPKRYEKYKIYKNNVSRIADILFTLYTGEPIKTFINDGVGFSKINTKSNLLIGYFQSYRNLENNRTLEKMRGIRLREIGPDLKTLRKEAENSRILVVHIRLGDYKFENDFGIPSREYYRNSIQEMLKSNNIDKIWMYSDEPELAINYIDHEVQHLVKIIEDVDNSDAATLESMRLGSAYIIANSTFSWWGATLSYFENAKVIFPSPWFKNMESPKDICTPYWKTHFANYDTND